MQGRVFNAHWMAYFDESFTEFIEALGEPVVSSELMHCVVAKSLIEWTGTARYRDEITIGVSVTRVGKSSFDLRFEASVDSEPVCIGTNTYVNLDGDTGRSRPLGRPLRSKLHGALAEAEQA